MSADRAAASTDRSRVVVALDAVDELSAVRMAALLARNLQVELTALFVEDSSLLEAAALPFVREVVRHTGDSRDLRADRLLRALQRQAEQVRSSLEGCARESSLRCSFRVVRGSYAREALAAAGERDVLVLGSPRPGAATPVREQTVAGWLRTLRSASRPVWVLHDGTPAGENALALAASITDPRERDLVVIVPAAGGEALRGAVRSRLGHHAPSARFVALQDLSPGSVFAAVRGNGISALLLPRSAELAARAAIDAWSAALGCAVVAVP